MCSGRRFGKTTLAILEMIAKAVSKNDQKIVYIAPTYQQARDIAWQELKKAAQGAVESVNESRLEIKLKTQYGGVSSVWLRGWESIETLRGQHFDFIVIDEIAMMRSWQENWQEVIRPTLTDTKGEALFISTPKGFNHFYDLFRQESKDQDYKSFQFTSYDNSYIPKEELDKARTELTEDRFAQEYLADFRKTEGLVYKEFDRKKHVTDEKPHNVSETYLGIDFGFTNPTAVVKVQKDNDGMYWVTDEWYKRGKTNQEVIEYVRTLGANEIFPDPAEPDRIEEMRRANLPVREVNKDVVAGIDAVHNVFRQDKIRIHSSCVNLINEFETYSYKPRQSNQNEQEEPIKENDHALDGLRYLLFMKAPKAQPIYETEQPFIFEPTVY